MKSYNISSVSRYCLPLLILLFLLSGRVPLTGQAPVLLDAVTHPKFEQNLPIPARIYMPNGGYKVMSMAQKSQWLGLKSPTGANLMTTIWGYGTNPAKVSYPGPTIKAYRNSPIEIMWQNKLPDTHLLPVDYTIHLPGPPHISHPFNNGIPAVAHLHGGHTEAESDGYPEAWFTKNFQQTGPYWVKKKYFYHNEQNAATLWYHDHALGITRLNVYAGLAGFYLLTDDYEQSLMFPAGWPATEPVLPFDIYDVEIAIQDRMFTPDGQLYFPNTASEFYMEDEIPPGAPTPTVLPEFFGDFIIVNGMAWPKFKVEPRKYRLRLLNGSDSRFYFLELDNGQPFLQIAGDNGFLSEAVEMTQLRMGPGERIEVIIDFSQEGSGDIHLINLGPDEPSDGNLPPPEEQANPATTGKIMKFVINKPLNEGIPEATVEAGFQFDVTSVEPAAKTRKLGLFEGVDGLGRLQPLLGTYMDMMDEFHAMDWFQPITEKPELGDSEIWEVYNFTADAHPVHLHLVSFKLLNRQEITYELGGDGPPMEGPHGAMADIAHNVHLVGEPVMPDVNETGWKDTGIAPSGMVTRLHTSPFNRLGLYVWHCHILSHEDHEMMRPFEVVPQSMALTVPLAEDLLLGQNAPNPFAYYTQINFSTPEEASVRLAIYDLQGRLVGQLLDQELPAGDHHISWDGFDAAGNPLPNGLYFYELVSGEHRATRKMLLQRSF